jgi:hypothetical protein
VAMPKRIAVNQVSKKLSIRLEDVGVLLIRNQITLRRSCGESTLAAFNNDPVGESLLNYRYQGAWIEVRERTMKAVLDCKPSADRQNQE